MDTPTLIYNQSRQFFDDNPTNKKFKKNISSIELVCDIPVNAELFIRKNISNWSIFILIRTQKILQSSVGTDKKILYVYTKDTDNLDINFIKLFLLNFQLNLNKLKFNKLLGIFTLKNEINQNLFGYDIFKDKYLNSKECCVCFEKTKDSTICNHSLCIECWSNLQTYSCPTCRRDNIVIHNDINYHYLPQILNQYYEPDRNNDLEESGLETIYDSEEEYEESEYEESEYEESEYEESEYEESEGEQYDKDSDKEQDEESEWFEYQSKIVNEVISHQINQNGLRFINFYI